MCALFFAPIWKILSNNYLHIVQVTIWSKRKIIHDLINKIFGEGPI